MRFFANIFTAACCLIIVITARGQEKSDSTSTVNTSNADTLSIDKELLADLKAMLDSIADRSNYFSVSVGVTNRLFSIRNNNFNAQQANNKVALTPSAAWYHRSGFGFSAVAFLSKPDEKAAFYQYAISPSYDNLKGKNLAYGISYSGYIVDKRYEMYATPFRHEGFAYIYNRKGWLRTTLSAGYGKGKFTQVSSADTLIFNTPRFITDTSLVGLQDFSIAASVLHSFEWDDVFNRGDGFSLVPQIMIAGGAQQYDVHSKKSVQLLRRYRIIQRSYQSHSIDNTGLRFQTIAASLNLSYYIGSFSLSPSYFYSYFFPESDDKTSHVFSVTAGFIF